MNLIKHIFFRLLLVAIPLLMAMAPAMAQNTVYAGQTSTLSVVAVPGETYEWELYDNVTNLNLAVVPGNCPITEAFFVGGINTGPIVQVTWLVPGTYHWKVTTTSSCTNNIAIGRMIVLNDLPTATIVDPQPICSGETANLAVVLTGTSPWSITYTDGTIPVTINGIMSSPYNIPVSPLVTASYWITNVTDAFGTNNNPSNTVTLIVKPTPVTSPIWHN